MKKILSIIIFLSITFNINSQDYPVSVGPAPVSDIKITPQETTPFAIGTRYFAQISSAAYQFAKGYLESCTLTNIGIAFPITFPGGLVYRNGMVYTWNQSSPFQLWSIDTVTGIHSLVFNMTGIPLANFTGMCWDGATMYGVSTSITQSQIFTVNMTTGACTPIGTASSVCAGAISLLGRSGSNYSLFSLDIVADNLYKWNKTNGVVTLVGPLGENINFGQDGCVDPHDFKFYNMTYTIGPKLRVVDTATGLLGPILCTYTAQATGMACTPPFFPTFTPINVCRNGLHKNISDHQTLYDTLTQFSYSWCRIMDLNVKVDTIFHTWVSDLSITLKRSVAGIDIPLITNRGGSGDNIIGCILNDSASNPISSGTAPFTGSFRPEQSLTAFNTFSPQGHWILSINDNASGDTGFLEAWCLAFLVDCSIGGIQQVEVPFTYRLYQNYPNPFNPVTTIKYGLPRYGLTSLTIYDILGRVIAKPVDNEFKDAGTYEVVWDASGYSSGIYFYTLESGNYKETKKMMSIK